MKNLPPSTIENIDEDLLQEDEAEQIQIREGIIRENENRSNLKTAIGIYQKMWKGGSGMNRIQY